MRMAFLGDVMLGRLVNETLKSMPPAYPWGNTLPVLKESDLRVCNLECVISDRGAPWGLTPKTFHFRSDAKNVDTLKSAGIDLVSLANNHTLDYEYEALQEMKTLLDRAGIAHAGAGTDIAEASKPALVKVGGVTVAFIAFTDNEPQWEASERQPGVHFVPVDRNDKRASKLFNLVKEARSRAELVVVAAHWGSNWGYQPPQEHVDFGHFLIDSGADIVFGHSCHVVRGVELYCGRPILYSAGDFVDDYAADEIERNDESFIFVVETEGSRITRLRLYPTVTMHMQARLAGPRDEIEIASRMQQLCERLGADSRWIDDRHCLEIEVAEKKEIKETNPFRPIS